VIGETKSITSPEPENLVSELRRIAQSMTVANCKAKRTKLLHLLPTKEGAPAAIMPAHNRTRIDIVTVSDTIVL